MDKETYQAAVRCAAMTASMLAQWDIPVLLSSIDQAESIGPLVDPTLYREKAEAMREDRDILKAALPLWRIGKKLAEMGNGQ